MYFASESFKEKEFVKDKKANLKLGHLYVYKAVKNGDNWGNITDLPINDKAYSISNPSLSKDGKTLYFSSTMPGGEGGVDIWKVSVSETGYGKPENLGKRVNTPGYESFPYLSDDNTLFFSSNGHKGFGVLDVFMIDLDKGTEAVNIGLPVNSPKDDFAFSFNTAKNIGFFSTNRNGNDDMYQANPVCSVEILTIVKDAVTAKLLSDAKVAILDDRKNVVETKTTLTNGEVSYVVDCDREYFLQVTKDGYESKEVSTVKTKGGKIVVAAELQPIEKIITPEAVTLNEIHFDFDKSNITKEGAFELDKLVQAMTKYSDMIVLVKSHTDNRGSDAYNLDLSHRRARSTEQYVLSKGIAKKRISGKGYGETEPKANCSDNCTEDQHAQNQRSEFIIVK